MPEILHFSNSDEANRLIATDPFALVIGFALDQQVTVQKAFEGPLVIRDRLGSLDVDVVADADLDAVFRRKPAVHRYPGSMAKRVHDLAVHVRDEYGGDVSRVWTEAADTEDLRRRIEALPGFGPLKIKSFGAVLARHLGVEAAEPLAPWHPTLGDVGSPEDLADYQAQKRLHKREWDATTT